MLKNKLVVALALAASAQCEETKDIKIGILSDLHLLITYNPDSADNGCNYPWKRDEDKEINDLMSSEIELLGGLSRAIDQLDDVMKDGKPVSEADKKALLGRLGCDSPKELIEYILILFNQVTADEPVKFIIINGDVIGHSVAQDPNHRDTKDYDPKKYELLKETHRQVGALITKYMPNTPVFFTLGNNDMKFEDQVPSPDYKEEFNGLLYDIWFKQHPANRKFMSKNLEETFMLGMFYSIEIQKGLELLALNTNFYQTWQKEALGVEAEMQMDWLDSKLDDDSGNKFILFSHIYAGGVMKHNQQSPQGDTYWKEPWNQRYFDMMKKHRERVIIELAGHDHWEDLRVNADDDGTEFRNLFIATGVTPIMKQMPGFNTMKIDGNTLKPKDLKQTILDISTTWGMQTLPPLNELPVRHIDFAKEYDFSDLSAHSIHERLEKFQHGDVQKTINYLSDKLGYGIKHSMFNQSLSTMSDWGLINKDHNNADTFYCMSMTGHNAKFINDCMNKQKQQRLNYLIAAMTETFDGHDRFLQ